MEADNRGPLIEQQAERLLIGEKRLVDFIKRRRRIHAKLGEKRGKMLRPRGFAFHVAPRRFVAEDIDVERQISQRPRLPDRLPRLRNRAGADPERAQSPAFDTAAARAGVDTPAIGA